MLSEDGPFLSLAVICERVLVEKDEVMSLIRIFDRWTVKGPFAKMPPTLVSLWLVVSLRSGLFRGSATVTIKPKSPSGTDLPVSQVSAQFPSDKGDEQGTNLLANLGIMAEEEGIYWFEILLDNKPITRVPLKLVYVQVEAVPTPRS
jgi:hypothetical protein